MTNLSKELCYICNFSTLFFNPENETLARVYPDFKKAENFVKLFSLPIKIKSSEPTETIIHILSRHFHIFDVEDFLSALCKYLTGYNDYGAQIIEAIKETEWIYE